MVCTASSRASVDAARAERPLGLALAEGGEALYVPKIWKETDREGACVRPKAKICGNMGIDLLYTFSTIGGLL